MNSIEFSLGFGGMLLSSYIRLCVSVVYNFHRML